MSGFPNSQTSSRAHLAVARGDRGSSRQTGWTVPGEGWGRSSPAGAGPGPVGRRRELQASYRPAHQALSCLRVQKSQERVPQQ